MVRDSYAFMEASSSQGWPSLVARLRSPVMSRARTVPKWSTATCAAPDALETERSGGERHVLLRDSETVARLLAYCVAAGRGVAPRTLIPSAAATCRQAGP